MRSPLSAPPALRPALPLAALLAVFALAAPSGASCTTPPSTDGNEPPCNPALVDSEWAASHRGSYAQASSPLRGPAPGDPVELTHADIRGIPIVLNFSPPYADGGRVAWASVVAMPETRGIYKIDVETGAEIDRWALIDEGEAPSSLGGVSGAYSVLDADGNLIVGRSDVLEVFSDSIPGDRSSPIVLVERFDMSPWLCNEDDELVGLSMTWDGHVAFATELGVVGVVPRQPAGMVSANVHSVSLNGAACLDGEAELEEVSNSIAVDEDGGIFVVTSERMHRVDWDGSALALAWSADYETGDGSAGARLGAGSGSTPSLMGTHPGDDELVVITDAQQLMHVVLFWRDEIPADWQPIAPGKDPRIACEFPVTFGDPDAEDSLSEQSVLVRGNATVVVNNELLADDAFAALPPQIRPLAVLTGQLPENAPYGIERIDWDPVTRTCHSVWSNAELSIPNGIPTMSTFTGLVYGIGQRDGTWGLEGVDFETGASALWIPTGLRTNENSFFAATEVGPDGSIWTGTFLGVTQFVNLPEPGAAGLVVGALAVAALGRRRRSG